VGVVFQTMPVYRMKALQDQLVVWLVM